MTDPSAPTPRTATEVTNDKGHVVPPRAAIFGMVLFLAALTMLFGSSLVGYLLIRLTSEQGPPMGAIKPPMSLWASTAIILASSYTVHRALDNLRHERQGPFRNFLVITLLLGAAFLVVQAPSLAGLLIEHRELAEGPDGFRLYGLVFFLVLVHALHVIGGLIPLGVIVRRAHAGRYDHEHHAPVTCMAMYWHFLDAVWLIMFAVLLLAA